MEGLEREFGMKCDFNKAGGDRQERSKRMVNMLQTVKYGLTREMLHANTVTSLPGTIAMIPIITC